MLGSLLECWILGGVPMHQMQFTRIRQTIDSVLGTLAIRTTPVAMELLQLEDIVHQWATAQLRTGAVHIDAPAIARIDQALCVLWHILPAQWLFQCAAACSRCGANVHR